MADVVGILVDGGSDYQVDEALDDFLGVVALPVPELDGDAAVRADAVPGGAAAATECGTNASAPAPWKTWRRVSLAIGAS